MKRFSIMMKRAFICSAVDSIVLTRMSQPSHLVTTKRQFTTWFKHNLYTLKKPLIGVNVWFQSWITDGRVRPDCKSYGRGAIARDKVINEAQSSTRLNLWEAMVSNSGWMSQPKTILSKQGHFYFKQGQGLPLHNNKEWSCHKDNYVTTKDNCDTIQDDYARDKGNSVTTKVNCDNYARQRCHSQR
jgi:hypothetical protein